MPSEQNAHTSIYLPRALLTALRKKLLDQGRSLSQWARDHAENDVKR